MTEGEVEAPMPHDGDTTKVRGSRWRRIGRAVGDIGLTVGMARGTDPRYRDDGLLARSAMLSEMSKLDGDERVRRPGMLDRVPGWLLIAIVLVVLAVVLLFTTWQY
jgi:hypothetical protein